MCIGDLIPKRKFDPRFKEGSLVNIRLNGIVTDVMHGHDEENTSYQVLIMNTNEIRQFISGDVNERGE